MIDSHAVNFAEETAIRGWELSSSDERGNPRRSFETVGFNLQRASIDAGAFSRLESLATLRTFGGLTRKALRACFSYLFDSSRMHTYSSATRRRLLRLRRSLFQENNVRLLRSCFTVGSRGRHRCLQRSRCRYRVEHYLPRGLKPTCAIKIMVRISHFSFSNKLPH